MKKNVTKVVCPKCGAVMEIPEHEEFVSGVTIAKDSGLGTVYLKTEDECGCGTTNNNNQNVSNKMKKASEKIEALKKAGVNVDNLFAISGSNGGEYIGRMENGLMSMVGDDDPIFKLIEEKGWINNRKLFRRYVMAKMFRLLTGRVYYWNSGRTYTESVHSFGYDYQWKMLINELYAQMKMKMNGDIKNFRYRNLFFNKEVVMSMARDYMNKLVEYIDKLPEKRCKRVPYKHIGGKNVFCCDIAKNILNPLRMAIIKIDSAKNEIDLHYYTKAFNNIRIKLPYSVKQSEKWFDAYKGVGAFYTIQNMLRFHNCFIINDGGYKLTGNAAETFLATKADEYKHEGWRLFGVMKKMIEDNGIDINEKINSWRKK